MEGTKYPWVSTLSPLTADASPVADRKLPANFGGLRTFAAYEPELLPAENKPLATGTCAIPAVSSETNPLEQAPRGLVLRPALRDDAAVGVSDPEDGCNTAGQVG